jgi:hypothetical protein
MKNSGWILGTIYNLCLSLLVGVLGSCDLQNDPPKPFYRFMASGVGSVEVGFIELKLPACSWYDVEGVPARSMFNGGCSEVGSWHKEMLEDEVLERKGPKSYALYERAARPLESPFGPLSTKIVYVDDKGNEKILVENSFSRSNLCVSITAQLWTPEELPLPTGPSGQPGGGYPVPSYSLTVICTELHRQGLMDGTIFKADEAFGKYLKENQKEVLIGYRFWAKPVVSLMQKSHIFTQIVNVLAKPWSYEMAYRVGARNETTFVGKILMDVGVPICRLIGRAVIWAGNIGNM